MSARTGHRCWCNIRQKRVWLFDNQVKGSSMARIPKVCKVYTSLQLPQIFGHSVGPG